MTEREDHERFRSDIGFEVQEAARVALDVDDEEGSKSVDRFEFVSSPACLRFGLCNKGDTSMSWRKSALLLCRRRREGLMVTLSLLKVALGLMARTLSPARFTV